MELDDKQRAAESIANRTAEANVNAARLESGRRGMQAFLARRTQAGTQPMVKDQDGSALQ